MVDLPFAYGGPALAGHMRVTPEDFIVDEVLGYDADGVGEHMLLVVEKRGANTQWVARQLARFADVPIKAVGFAGLKDRHALTRQAFSVQLPGRTEPDWSALGVEGVRVLSSTLHRRKLKRGALAGNRFVLTIRDLIGDCAQAQVMLQTIAKRGVPNYFGAQRFGRFGDNVEQARAMFSGKRVKRSLRSILISAARAQLFNKVLAERVQRRCWDTPLDGEVWCLNGSHSWFGPERFDDSLRQRLGGGDIHPSGPMWGRGRLPTTGVAYDVEQTVADGEPALTRGLENERLEQARRPLRVQPRDMQWQRLDDRGLQLSFWLPAGAYATAVMRELLAGKSWNCENDEK